LLPSQLALTGGPTTALWWGLGFGIAAIAGHAKPIFLLWKGGGKGVATAAGVFAALAPAALGVALTAFALVVWRTRIVSAASITAAVVLPVAVAVTMGTATPVFAVSLLIGAFVVFTHRANIQRLRAGTEPRLGRATKEAAR
jgi:glycerol-3-phosphate acyltransferase PlsY